MINAPISTANDKNGNGKYAPLRRKVKEEAQVEAEVQEFVYLDKNDTRMIFNNSKDPIYFAFEYLEKRSLTQLAGDFVKDSLFEITNFISKAAR